MFSTFKTVEVLPANEHKCFHDNTLHLLILAITCLLRYRRRHNVTALFANMIFSLECKILIKIHISWRDIMRDSWGQNFQTKDGRQVGLTGCSRSSETWAQWTDVRAATDREVPARMQTMTRWTIWFWVKRTSPELTAQSVKYRGRQAFLSHLLSASSSAEML